MIEQKTLSTQTWIALFVLGSIWGLSFVSIRVALDEIGPLTAVAHRTFWAMLVLWVIVLLMRLTVPRNPSVWGAFLIMGLLNNVIPFSLMAWGQVHIESGLTSILNAATAIFGVLVAALFFADERLTFRKTVGVLVGFAGVVVAIGHEALAYFDVRSLAQIAVLGGTVSYALAGVWARKKLSALPPLVAAAGMLTGSSLITLPVAVIFEGPMNLSLQPKTLIAIAYYSMIATAGAYLLYYHILTIAGSGNLMLVTLLVAPVTIIAGAWILDETLSVNAYAGFALLAFGLIILDGRVFAALLNKPASHGSD